VFHQGGLHRLRWSGQRHGGILAFLGNEDYQEPSGELVVFDYSDIRLAARLPIPLGPLFTSVIFSLKK